VISEEEKMPEMMAGDATSKSSFPKPEALLDKYLAAIGGADALKKVTSRIQRGTITAFGNQKFPIDIFEKAPNQRVSVVRRKDMESFTGFDGKSRLDDRPGHVRMMTAQESDGAQMDADIAFAAHLSAMFSKLEVSDGDEIVVAPVGWLLAGGKANLTFVSFSIKQSGVLLRMVSLYGLAAGTEFRYRSTSNRLPRFRWRQIPFRWTQARPGIVSPFNSSRLNKTFRSTTRNSLRLLRQHLQVAKAEYSCGLFVLLCSLRRFPLTALLHQLWRPLSRAHLQQAWPLL